MRYIELFWNWTGLKHFMTYAEGQDAIVAGLIEGEEKYGIVGRLVPSIDREALPEDAVELVREMTLTALPGSSVWGSTTAKRSTNPKISGKPIDWHAMPALN